MATQIAGAEGMGLMHGVERFTGAVWERHCPAEDQPPVWVERQLWPDLTEDDDDTSPWSTAPQIGEARGPLIYFPMRWSMADGASAHAAGVASSMGLNCFDPQARKLRH
ncbi:hypothetical protein ACFVU4_32085 [Streptomyces sp. NPDC058107]|uniref:hypothetical protein n=1 Tax=Streptomyces sp. NPDC058107 TaxID=3346343 RepID=UPI0036E6D304